MNGPGCSRAVARRGPRFAPAPQGDRPVNKAPSSSSLRAPRRFHGEWIATGSEARLRLLNPFNLETMMLLDHPSDGLAAIRTQFGNFCVIGTEPLDLAGHVAVARPGREDVQAQREGRRYCGTFEAVCRAEAQGAGRNG